MNEASRTLRASGSPGPRTATEPPCVRKLLGGGRELLIDHNGARYRLRLTASGKLILTK